MSLKGLRPFELYLSGVGKSSSCLALTASQRDWLVLDQRKLLKNLQERDKKKRALASVFRRICFFCQHSDHHYDTGEFHLKPNIKATFDACRFSLTFSQLLPEQLVCSKAHDDDGG